MITTISGNPENNVYEANKSYLNNIAEYCKKNDFTYAKVVNFQVIVGRRPRGLGTNIWYDPEYSVIGLVDFHM
jgi:hypothetical protein